MPVSNPPPFIQSGSHSAASLRRLTGSLTADVSGVIRADDLKVAQAVTPSMAVLVAAGRGYVVGSESAVQGSYHVESQGSETLAIAASNPTNPRIDLIVARVQDTAFSGVVDGWSLAVIAGTPAGAPVAPTAPDSSIVLARVAVAAGVTTITNANITDLRPRARPDWTAPWGLLATAQVSASTNATGTIVDVTGLTVTTAVIPAGRWIRTTVVGNASSSNATDVAAFTLTDQSNGVKNRFDSGELAGATRAFSHSWVEQSAGGVITRKLRIQRVVGSGTVTMFANADRKAQIVIEDIGAV